MATYRLLPLANLARQLVFTPLEVRAFQVAAAESLLHDLDSQKAYPIDFVIFRITGYQPKSEAVVDGHSDLFTGLALQHDLGLLIEEVSDGLDLHASAAGEPVLSIDDVTQQFNVTSKTIQRWRRKGLPARRFTFADGKRRVGFLLSSVERFIARHADQLESTTLVTCVRDDEQENIARHARRLVSDCHSTQEEICLRIGRRFHRTPMTVLHTLKKHDADRPDVAVLPLAAEPLAAECLSRVLTGHRRGLSIKQLARRAKRSYAVVYRAVMHDRVARLNKRKIRFIDDELYHDADADRAISVIVSQQELGATPSAVEMRVPRDLPPYLGDLYRTPLLSPSRERALFLKFNFHKYQFVCARRRLEPEFARARDLDLLENHLQDISRSKNQILQANLRLVVSVARRHVRPGVCLMELVSEGNIILMRAVEGFDTHKGNRFSTYATLALMKGFAQAVPMMLASHRGTIDNEILTGVADHRQAHSLDQRLDREHVQHLLNRLDDRERQVLSAHFGLESSESATYEQVGEKLGLSKQRVRQIEQTALAKLRL